MSYLVLLIFKVREMKKMGSIGKKKFNASILRFGSWINSGKTWD